jgi:hypothetical protein
MANLQFKAKREQNSKQNVNTRSDKSTNPHLKRKCRREAQHWLKSSQWFD